MAQAAWPLVQRKFGETSRRDFWWTQPLAVFVGLSFFGAYLTWAAFQGDHYALGLTCHRFTHRYCSVSAPCVVRSKAGWWPARFRFRRRC